MGERHDSDESDPQHLVPYNASLEFPCSEHPVSGGTTLPQSLLDQYATAEIIAELERLLEKKTDYDGGERGDEVWFEYIRPEDVNDRIKYYKAKETQL